MGRGTRWEAGSRHPPVLPSSLTCQVMLWYLLVRFVFPDFLSCTHGSLLARIRSHLHCGTFSPRFNPDQAPSPAWRGLLWWCSGSCLRTLLLPAGQVELRRLGMRDGLSLSLQRGGKVAGRRDNDGWRGRRGGQQIPFCSPPPFPPLLGSIL